MTLIAEILSEDVIWLISEDRKLISIHKTLEDVHYYCNKHFQVAPAVKDRRISGSDSDF